MIETPANENNGYKQSKSSLNDDDDGNIDRQTTDVRTNAGTEPATTTEPPKSQRDNDIDGQHVDGQWKKSHETT